MGLLRYCVDRWLRFSVWWSTRRDTIARLAAEIERLNRLHQQEVDALSGQLRIKQEQVAAMAEMLEHIRSITKANLALNQRTIAEATMPGAQQG